MLTSTYLQIKDLFDWVFQICLNGKCVIEHENAIDYEGPGFLRRSGLADTGIDRDDFEADTPAEPTHERYEKNFYDFPMKYLVFIINEFQYWQTCQFLFSSLMETFL